MKRLMTAFVALGMLAACAEVQESPEYQALAQRNDSLQSELQQREARTEEVAQLVNEIENNLAAIERSEVEIESLKDEGQEQQRDKINRMIRGIDSYIVQNQQRLDQLDAQLRKSRGQNQGLNSLVASLRRNVKEREGDVTRLRQTITVLETEVDTLRMGIASRDEELASSQLRIKDQETSLNTAYYRVGSRDDLVEASIIEKEGGVLGIGKTFVLTDKLKPSSFNKINIRELQEVELGEIKKHMMVSSHPAGTYKVTEREGKSYLQITDQDGFWSVSRYLVVATES